MEIIRVPRIMQDTARGYLLHSRTIGFVPTMGALHDGHMSLVRLAREENTVSVVSIFVNPSQFGPTEDFASYPRTIEQDIERLRQEDVDILFLPDASLIYPPGFCTVLDVAGISEKLCGAHRPGHFRGVATVVAKLLNITTPTRSYFGQKDFQQTVIIRRMVKDLNLPGEIVVCPTVREEDDLAMSSRNRYLDTAQRAAAPVLFRALTRAAEAVRNGVRSGAEIRDILQQTLSQEPMVTSVDYAGVYEAETLEAAGEISGDVVLAIAARIGSIRLIDNMIVSV